MPINYHATIFAPMVHPVQDTATQDDDSQPEDPGSPISDDPDDDEVALSECNDGEESIAATEDSGNHGLVGDSQNHDSLELVPTWECDDSQRIPTGATEFDPPMDGAIEDSKDAHEPESPVRLIEIPDTPDKNQENLDMLAHAKAQTMKKRSELEDKISEISMKLNNAKKMYTSRFLVLKTIVVFLTCFLSPP